MGLDGVAPRAAESNVSNQIRCGATQYKAHLRDPKSGASANSATFAFLDYTNTSVGFEGGSSGSLQPETMAELGLVCHTATEDFRSGEIGSFAMI